MKYLIPSVMMSIVSASTVFAQTPCVNLSGKFIESAEHVTYPNAAPENDTPVIKQTIEMSESSDCKQVTFTSTDSTTGQTTQKTFLTDGVARNPLEFNGARGTDANGNKKSGNLTFYSAYSLTSNGFNVDLFSSLNGGPMTSDNVTTSYSLDSSGNLITSRAYPDGVVITYTYQKAN